MFTLANFYSFQPLSEPELPVVEKRLRSRAEKENITGLVILSTEGINTTLAGEKNSLEDYVQWLFSDLSVPDQTALRYSHCDKPPFKRFSVKIRPEIVTFHRSDIVPSAKKKNHLSPQEWDEMLQSPNTKVIDTRNLYETKIGKFKGAIDLEIDEFTELPEKLKERTDLNPKDNYLIYCTGGIRCEKAIYALEEMGLTNTYQLDGGILNYLKSENRGHFEGECFVFDSRVSVDQNLEPSKKYSLCPHCGDVADTSLNCKKCDTPTLVCQTCLEKPYSADEVPGFRETCSKNCAYHYQRAPHQKGPQQSRHYHG